MHAVLFIFFLYISACWLKGYILRPLTAYGLKRTYTQIYIYIFVMAFLQ